MICPACGKEVRVVAPKGGDGSAEVFVRHDDADGRRCSASRATVR